MGMLLATIITLAVVAFIANALVDGYAEGKDINKWIMRVCKAIVCILLLGILMLLGKCGSPIENEYTPSGETTLEHYEPR